MGFVFLCKYSRFQASVLLTNVVVTSSFTLTWMWKCEDEGYGNGLEKLWNFAVKNVYEPCRPFQEQPGSAFPSICEEEVYHETCLPLVKAYVLTHSCQV